MNPLILRLDQYWKALAGGRAPAREVFDPAAITDLLPYLLLAETVPGQSLRIRYRLVGSAIEAISALRAGQYLDQYFNGPNEAANRELLQHYLAIIETGTSRFGAYTYHDKRDSAYTTEWAIYPLTVAGKIQQFVAIEDCRQIPPTDPAPLSSLARRHQI